MQIAGLVGKIDPQLLDLMTTRKDERLRNRFSSYDSFDI
jgi:hypothetical protein